MTLADYLDHTFRELTNRIEGYRKKEQEIFRDKWERERWSVAVMLNAWSKKAITPRALLKFPWEKKAQTDRVPTKAELMEIIKAKKWV